ncbi:hypothetical protein BABINDRAFT_7207 [Babjeviella inositovora NRRL Y-12698]|uniref:Cohesin loading factor n=1 Tax=Babjeviella inositovora NRRL Y-12698 TaxID=984486 RepID=A0A1E3QS53_9ASCO|nr:uncharacterized protein BABINDRAFT_7207 [Babjeviella inositovora NRRL Y-12698]ODQ80468.1 hypothetical protein BABINDRAFT_7207 [Babjeviella inositovora NRRL Y-12698]
MLTPATLSTEKSRETKDVTKLDYIPSGFVAEWPAKAVEVPSPTTKTNDAKKRAKKRKMNSLSNMISKKKEADDLAKKKSNSLSLMENLGILQTDPGINSQNNEGLSQNATPISQNYLGRDQMNSKAPENAIQKPIPCGPVFTQTAPTTKETSPIPRYTKSLFEKVFNDATMNKEFRIGNLILASDYFLQTAHRNVLKVNTDAGLLEYCKCIKAAIQALLILAKRYFQGLTPQLQALVCFKLAKLYFYETENLARAEDYINKAITIASRNNLVQLKFASEFLAVHILNKSNSRAALSYLNTTIANFSSLGLRNHVNILRFLKINNLLVIDFQQGMSVLKSLSADATIDPLTRQLCVLYEMNLHLYRGSPRAALQLHAQLQDIRRPVQMTAMLLLNELMVHSRMGQFEKFQQTMVTVNRLILGQRETKWCDWSEDGAFSILIPVNLNDVQSSHISYKVNWINSDELVILYYFICGLAYMTESFNGKKKANKFFSLCLKITGQQLGDLQSSTKTRNFGITLFNSKVLRLQYFQYTIHYYQCLDSYQVGEYTLGPLEDLIQRYENGLLTPEQVLVFNLLIPRVYYLFAMYYQERRQPAIATQYFQRVRAATCAKGTPSTEGMKLSLQTLAVGIGCEMFEPVGEYNEVYVFATIHLAILAEKELVGASREASIAINETRSELYSDLAVFFSPQHESTFVLSSVLLALTHQVTTAIYQESSQTTNLLLLIEQELERKGPSGSKITTQPFLAALTYLLLFQHKHEQKYLEMAESQCSLISNTPLQILVGLTKERHFRRNGNAELADLEKVKVTRLYETKAKC